MKCDSAWSTSCAHVLSWAVSTPAAASACRIGASSRSPPNGSDPTCSARAVPSDSRRHGGFRSIAAPFHSTTVVPSAVSAANATIASVMRITSS